MCTSVLRGTKLGWGYFLRACPEIYEEVREWMMKTWGASQPKTRRGFHISCLKKEYINTLKTRYEQVYDTKHVLNNEVGTIFARAFACEVQGGIEVDWEDFTCHRSTHYRGSSSINTGLKSEDTSHIEMLVRTLVPYNQIPKGKVTLSEKQEEVLMNWIAATKTRIEQLLADLEAVTSGEIVAEKQFSSISTIYDWIASTIQKSGSDVLKEELKIEMKNMGAQLGSVHRDLQSLRSSRVEIDDKLRALKPHSENLVSLIKHLKEKGFETMCPSLVEHPTCMETVITINISRCVFCGLGFKLEAMDVVITPCLHTFHILCAKHHFEKINTCIECKSTIGAEWYLAMGLKVHSSVSDNTTPGKAIDQPTPMHLRKKSAANSKVRGRSLAVTHKSHNEDECMRRALGIVEHVTTKIDSPSSALPDIVKDVQEPKKKRNAARELNGKGKKCRVSYSDKDATISEAEDIDLRSKYEEEFITIPDIVGKRSHDEEPQNYSGTIPCTNEGYDAIASGVEEKIANRTTLKGLSIKVKDEEVTVDVAGTKVGDEQIQTNDSGTVWSTVYNKMSQIFESNIQGFKASLFLNCKSMRKQ